VAYNDWQPIIGLEIHAQLSTKSKIFSNESAHFGSGDNEAVGPVSLGLPGALPVLNKEVIRMAVRAGVALNCQVQGLSQFARKNYFYPDMPKGYQISQYDQPICKNGRLEFLVDQDLKTVRIQRIHLEEDAGKSIHYGDYTALNFNRAGVPLIEIVSEPDIVSGHMAAEYARAVRQTLRYIGVCDGNLEEGSLRVDCNVSVRRPGQPLGTKVELKNLNSFRFIEKAVDYEIQRQIDSLESGRAIAQETRLYDSVKNITTLMRSKENAEDYRYFPEPDLVNCEVSDLFIEEVKKTVPELPLQRLRRYEQQVQMKIEDAAVLTTEKELADYFERVAERCDDWKLAAHWVRSDFLGEMQSRGLNFESAGLLSPHQLGDLLKLIKEGTITGKMAKGIFLRLWDNPNLSPSDIVKNENLTVVSDQSLIESVARRLIEENQAQAQQYREGKTKVMGFFVGRVMKETGGQANPDVVNAILKKWLES
jgi:aspartyl-tRNA(Asn)/glutamyl-tRNA(Gln) amidotransferase subunit B